MPHGYRDAKWVLLPNGYYYYIALIRKKTFVSEPANRDANRFIIRMPEGMRDRIKAHAEHHNRSMNAQIIFMLDNALFQSDFERVQLGLPPLGDVPQDDLDRMHLFIEDDERRTANRTKTLSAQGIDQMLEAIHDRIARLEASLSPPDDEYSQPSQARKGKD